MKKKILISTFFVLSIIFFGAFVNLKSAEEVDFSVFLDSKPITLSKPIMVKNGTIILPIEDMFKYFDAHLVYYDSEQKLTCYSDNAFANLYIDQNAVFINGNRIEYNEPISKIDSTIYAPSKFFSDYFVLEHQTDNNIIKLKSRNDQSFIYLGSMLNAEIRLPNHDLKIALPEGWRLLNDGSFGVLNPYEKYSFNLNITKSSGKFNPDTQFKNIVHNIKKDKNSIINDLSRSEIVSGNHTFYCLYYTIEDKEQQALITSLLDNLSAEKPDFNDEIITKHHAHYLMKSGDKIYEFHFAHSKAKLQNEILSSFEDCLYSIKVPPYRSSTVYEHYIEYPEFTNSGIVLDSKINSSMEVYNHFNFAGKSKNLNVDKIYVEVSRNKFIKTSSIKISDIGEFDDLIYVPFGIGKHDISIYKLGENNKKILLLQFNVVNLSPKDILYLTSTEYVKANSKKIKKIVNGIKSQNEGETSFVNDYQIAKRIFDYTLKKAIIDDKDKNTDEIMSAEDLNLNEKISKLEANIYLCSLLRAAEIPSRIMIGYKKDDKKEVDIESKYIYIESKINGKWRILDINRKKIFMNLNYTSNFDEIIITDY